MENSLKAPKRVAIIGAGIAGISAAWQLSTKSHNFKISIFEKSKTLAGRVATRRKEGYYWDNGANYFSADNEEIEKLVLEKFSKGQIVEIPKPIWTFDKENNLKEGDSSHNKKKKYSFDVGIKQLVKNIWSEVKGVELVYEKRLQKLIQKKDEKEGINGSVWQLISTENEELGDFDFVLLTPPSPQMADIFEKSEFLNDEPRKVIHQGFKENPYKANIAVTFAFKKILDKPWFALLNLDREHDISWICFDSDKSGHAPEGECTLVVQMADDWSTKHYENSDDDLKKAVYGQLKKLLKDDDLDSIFLWDDVKKWKLALPSKVVDSKAIEAGKPLRLHFAGDFLVGKGRVLGAMEMGIKAADSMLEQFKEM